jgi:hypothetical protein
MSAGMEQDDPLTKQVIGCAIEGHRTLEPGLLESAYEARLVHELTVGGLHAVAQVPLAVHYKGAYLRLSGYQLGLLLNFNSKYLKDGIIHRVM